MLNMIRYIALCCLAMGVTTLAYGEEPKEMKPEKGCPEGQVYDKDLDACISAPAEAQDQKADEDK